jgi:hypothetical protein
MRAIRRLSFCGNAQNPSVPFTFLLLLLLVINPLKKVGKKVLI